MVQAASNWNLLFYKSHSFLFTTKYNVVGAPLLMKSQNEARLSGVCLCVIVASFESYRSLSRPSRMARSPAARKPPSCSFTISTPTAPTCRPPSDPASITSAWCWGRVFWWRASLHTAQRLSGKSISWNTSASQSKRLQPLCQWCQ